MVSWNSSSIMWLLTGDLNSISAFEWSVYNEATAISFESICILIRCKNVSFVHYFKQEMHNHIPTETNVTHMTAQHSFRVIKPCCEQCLKISWFSAFQNMSSVTLFYCDYYPKPVYNSKNFQQGETDMWDFHTQGRQYVVYLTGTYIAGLAEWVAMTCI